MPVKVQGSILSLTPNRALLEASDSGEPPAYPVYIDPSLGLEQPKRWMVSNQVGNKAGYPNIDPIWQFSEPQGMGLCSGDPRCRTPHVKRLYFEFARGNAVKKRVLTASFKARETWAWSCEPRVVDLYLANKKLNKSLTWKTRPVTVKRLAARNVSAGYGTPCNPDQPPKDVEFRSAALTTAVRQLAKGTRSQLTLMLKARNEKDSYGWKKFSKDALLRVIYANDPLIPDPTGVKGESGVNPKCTTSADVSKGRVTTLATNRPWLVARMKAYPAAGSKTRAVFEVGRKPQGATKWTDDFWSGQYPAKKTDWATAGATVSVRPSKADAFDEKIDDKPVLYRMRARTESYWSYELSKVTRNGTLKSGASPWCYFRISVEGAHAPTVVSRGPYVTCTLDGCQAAGAPGTAGSFTFTAFKGTTASAGVEAVAANTADTTVTEFQYQLMTPGSPGTETRVPATTNSGKPGATATVALTPTSGGPAQLTVKACDGAGCGEPQVFNFAVKTPTGPVSLWRFADAPGAKTASDTAPGTTSPKALTLRGRTSTTVAALDTRGRRGNVEGDQALALGTEGMYAETDRPVTVAGQSFTVSAWVYRSGTATGTVVSQTSNDAGSTGWALTYSENAWVFDWHWKDSSGNPQSTRSKSATVSSTPAGTWTHVAGVF